MVPVNSLCWSNAYGNDPLQRRRPWTCIPSAYQEVLSESNFSLQVIRISYLYIVTHTCLYLLIPGTANFLIPTWNMLSPAKWMDIRRKKIFYKYFFFIYSPDIFKLGTAHLMTTCYTHSKIELKRVYIIEIIPLHIHLTYYSHIEVFNSVYESGSFLVREIFRLQSLHPSSRTG